MISRQYFLLIISLIFCCCFGAFAQNYSVLSIPPELLKNANTVVRLDHSSFTVEDTHHATYQSHFVVTRLNENAAYETLQLGYDKHSKITKLEVRIFNAAGKEVRKIKKSEIADRSAFDGVSFYTDNRQKVVDLSYSDYPYTIELSYEESYDGLLGYPGQTIQSFYTSVQNYFYQLSIPVDFNFDYRVNNIELEPKIAEQDKRKIYTWDAKNLPAIQPEASAPPVADLLPHIVFAPEQFGMDEYTGSMKDWKTLGDFFYGINIDREKISPELTAKLQSLTADATTDEEKIARVYRFLQKNTRYVSIQLGIGGYQSFPATYVESNQYGDCKALTWYMKGMLQALGIEAIPALVRAGSEYWNSTVAQDFALDNFNHVILHVPAHDAWYECTSNDNPPGYLGTFTDNRDVLLITEAGGQLSRTPALRPEDNRTVSTTKIKLTAAGAASIERQSSATGAAHELYRSLLTQLTAEERRKYFIRNSDLPSFTLQSLDIKVDPDTPTGDMTYTAEVPKYAAKAGKRLFVPFNLVDPYDGGLPQDDDRRFPVVVRRGFESTEIIEFELPDGYEVETLGLEEIREETEFGSYSLTIKQEGSTVFFDRRLSIQPVKIAAERYEEIREFYKTIAKMDAAKLVLVEKKT